MLNRVGKQTEQALKKLGLEKVEDLLFYFPFRYEDYSQRKLIKDIQAGDNISLKGVIEMIQNKRSLKQKKRLTEAIISDNTGLIKAIWFNQSFITQNLKVGDEISLAGKVAESYGQLSLISPQYEKISHLDNINTQGLVPVYHLNSGLSQKQLRFLIAQVLDAREQLTEWLPAAIIKNLNLMELQQAIKELHFPSSWDNIQKARLRLGFSELFVRQLRSQLIKFQLKSRTAHIIEFQELLTKSFVKSLPFQLTKGQKQAAWEIIQDIGKNKPMSRLLEGDVGSGKTVVAAMALLNVAANKKQATLMAPTEILAWQHYQNIIKLLEKFNLKIGLLSANKIEANFSLNKNKQKAKEEILTQAEIIIGTHALIQNYQIKDLALSIVDEQHRFGVKQRQKLQQSGGELTPHFLSMTATPIPRSLALSIYGDLDLSLIKEMPAGRKAVISKIISEEKRAEAYQFLRQEIQKGGQAFVICPLIDESDKLGVRSATAEFKRLKNEVFPDLHIGLIHGRLKSQEKEKAMQEFAEGKTQILIATAVVEVGVDVPNANLMLIEGAERFGLSQLHQFRGRIGRGQAQAYCLLLTSQDEKSADAAQRLQALTKYHDGLSIAQIDLKLRGAGDLYGLAQSGFPELKIASLFDYELIKKAKEEAEKIINQSPDLRLYPLLQAKMMTGQENEAHLE
jgi:ATP-dependent DNA helicase RecG